MPASEDAHPAPHGGAPHRSSGSGATTGPGQRDERPASQPGHAASSTPPETVPISEYAVIGDLQSCALVSRQGSVDWLCLPRFDSPSCFTALLGTPDHGRWLLGPADPEGVTTTRRYVGETFVLETTHVTPTGTVRVVDAMPLGDHRHDIVRIVEGVEGTVRMRHEWVVRFGYGRIKPWVSRGLGPGGDADRVITAVAGPDLLVLRGSRLPRPVDGRHVDVFDVAAGDRLAFSTTWLPSHLPVPHDVATDATVRVTLDWWEDWAHGIRHEGRYHDAVVRSLLVLRLLTSSTTGGIVAAPTTSLPEDFGGERNWDYRFCWLRDASLTLSALVSHGYVEETALWRRWLIRAVAGDPEDLQIMYAVDGARELPEQTLDHLPGYAGSRPVRVGNGAVGQRQTDVLGEVMIALAEGRDAGLEDDTRAWRIQTALVDELAERWQEPDHGLWEIRGPQRHFTHSQVMVWAAFDRAVKAVEQGLPAPEETVARWRSVRDAVRARVLEKGYDAERGTFVQHDQTREVDASLLVLAQCGFVEPHDPRFLGTVKAVEEDLLRDGLVLRYRTDSGVDGLGGDEHPFLACSFWLVDAYARTGQLDKGHALMDRLVGLANDVGLLSEEYDPQGDRMAGNMPQAFSHLALIGAARQLATARAAAGRDTADV
ncbi:glycoside hydrolase family 15 protein [Lapillicoccus jejuensis]|uniref:GH15 family glucan-1,4-alpha-glucosidase n=1 Tax=Lapillicoccus jejuensis TaxID=402171 RepID=A0A542E486_9MICO|nr:glycoside hydrolase family 15 protein [Lapillicoccus jejuensis]TQJ10099.1 GH15 family glucan-1,4-alpha-glucosidase [Lapillicoccus jejuensis]